jgi:hypothetical protein
MSSRTQPDAGCGELGKGPRDDPPTEPTMGITIIDNANMARGITTRLRAGGERSRCLARQARRHAHSPASCRVTCAPAKVGDRFGDHDGLRAIDSRPVAHGQEVGSLDDPHMALQEPLGNRVRRRREAPRVT